MTNDAPVLSTDRFELRKLRPGDAVAMTALMQNWNVLRMLSSPPHPYTLTDAEDFIAYWLARGNTPTNCAYAIAIGDALVGVISIRPNARGEPDLGYWLGEAYWGKGVMSDAAALLIRYYFDSSVEETLYSAAYLENPASIRIQEKTGFIQISEIEIYSKSRDCKIKSVATRLTRDAFERQRP